MLLVLKCPDVQAHGRGQGLLDRRTTLRLPSQIDEEIRFEAAAPDPER